ncbi:MAG: DNA double-strand break repair nuclease NurA [Hadesarchaea archaeon]|nr:DNA double-strand break repair nuclease NurA [Hadesarchaea archaeon]
MLEIVERIRERNARQRAVAEFIRGLKDSAFPAGSGSFESGEVIEQKFVYRVKPDELADATVVGVDGGVLASSLHGLDLIMTRAVAAIFSYSGGGLSKADYFPSEMPEPKLVPISEPLDAHELELVVSMERQVEELRLAASAIGAYDAELLLLDGSVVPQYLERSPRGKIAPQLQRALLDAYVRLYEGCAASDTLLVGVVKDSRGARFIEVLRRALLDARERYPTLASALAVGEDVLSNSRDTVFLDHVLETGERSFVFRYADAAPAVRGLEGWIERTYAFYLKAVPYDCPLRVEFVDGGDGALATVERVASLVYALSSYHDAYGLPSVLIEADARARLHEEDLDMVRDSIADRLGASTSLYMRRRRGPF